MKREALWRPRGWRALALSVIVAAAVLAPPAYAQDDRSSPREPGPVFSDSGPDAELYGAAMGYPVGARGTATQVDKLVGVYSHFGEIYPSRPVGRAMAPWQFKRAPEPSIAYSFGNERLNIGDYLKRNPVTGLLIARDDTILYEHYQYARTDRDRFLSQSMAKTLVAMLVGIAVSEGRIKSIDDIVSTYVPGLAGTEYGNTSIRALLNMSSGVEFSEVYDGHDDIARLGRALFVDEPKDPAAIVAQFNIRTAPPGTKWHYASVETEILGLVLRAATGTPVADYLHDRIWDPIGTEADASWAIDGSGQEIAFCCFNATLRDYARLGRLLAHDGAWEGRQLIPRQWLLDATTVRPGDGHLAPGVATSYFGYGYQVWLLPREPRRFALLGIRGQVILVDPTSKLIMVHTAVRQKPSEPGALREPLALWSAVLQQLGQ
ncbi:serine hydrolase [Bradyrhizobium sp. UNPA324]|uniref:serine hydrolase domain-containing protein n=1 Tax=Bradyrhizobium sp. UNPA324 TaxID=1141174 RepID=UPI001174A00B|nr:serine hydrolase [Bradyrhizobium sp. UNPA324]TQF32494.1 beta-lactamase family protein [Bradyrhizobium sp. UNPA324]